MVSEHTLTSRAKDFMRRNKTAGIVSGEWLDKDRRKATGHPDTWVKLRYRLDNGQQFTLNEADMESLRRAGFEPRWFNDAAISKATRQTGDANG